MKRIVSLMLTVIMLLCSCAAFADAATDDSYQKILDNGNLIMGLDDSFPPMGYRDENGDIVGFDVDVLEKSAAAWASNSCFSQFLGMLRSLSLTAAISIASGMECPSRRNVRKR